MSINPRPLIHPADHAALEAERLARAEAENAPPRPPRPRRAKASSTPRKPTAKASKAEAAKTPAKRSQSAGHSRGTAKAPRPSERRTAAPSGIPEPAVPAEIAGLNADELRLLAKAITDAAERLDPAPPAPSSTPPSTTPRKLPTRTRWMSF